MCNLCCLGPLSTSSVFSCMVDAQSNAMFVSLDFKLYIWNVNESSKSLEICIFEILYDLVCPVMIFDTGHSAMSTENRKKFHYFLCRFQKSKQKVPHYRHYSIASWESEATPSATPFFKRAYKISHPPQL